MDPRPGPRGVSPWSAPSARRLSRPGIGNIHGHDRDVCRAHGKDPDALWPGRHRPDPLQPGLLAADGLVAGRPASHAWRAFTDPPQFREHRLS